MDRSEFEEEKARWLTESYSSSPEGEGPFITVSSEPVEPLYGPGDIEDLVYERDLSFPGEFPYTRGIRGNMYRGRPWTMRQFSGFGNARETNQRYKFPVSYTHLRAHE